MFTWITLLISQYYFLNSSSEQDIGCTDFMGGWTEKMNDKLILKPDVYNLRNLILLELYYLKLKTTQIGKPISKTKIRNKTLTVKFLFKTPLSIL